MKRSKLCQQSKRGDAIINEIKEIFSKFTPDPNGQTEGRRDFVFKDLGDTVELLH